MKHKFITAPLLSLTLLVLFFQPLKTGELIQEPRYPIEQQMPLSGIAAQPAPRFRAAEVSPAEFDAQETVVPARQSLGSAVFQEAGSVDASLEDLAPDLKDFITQVSEGSSGTDLGGVHISGVFSLKVEQQPEDKATHVSTALGSVTQFRSAARNGVTGLLAHNYLSGKLFYNIALGQEVNLVYGDGSIKRYQVSDIQSFQKLTPSSLRGDLIDLETGRKYSTAQVYNRFYTGSDHVTFQTCLEGEGISNWGLTFFVATPVH